MSTDAKAARFFEVSLQESFQWKSLSLRAKGPLAFVIFCVVAISMLLFYSFWNSWTTNLVFEMSDLYKQQKSLEDENAAVRAEIAMRESLAEVEKRAAAIGLTYNTTQISTLPIAYAGNRAAQQPASGVALFRNQFSSNVSGAGRNLPAMLGALVAQFQEWVDAPYTSP
jgi:hypothetical protein